MRVQDLQSKDFGYPIGFSASGSARSRGSINYAK